ncbi:MAG: hypothetical protein OK452_08625 [Thaumarchaeota archaeon]|nr:hypothetical protein [Nitrososphaerota archaeon]
MRRLFVCTSAVVILLPLFLLLPLFAYQSSFYQVGGGTYDHWHAQVSASYLVLGCGMAYGMNLTTMVVGNGSWSYSKGLGTMFVCFNEPNQILGHP